MQLFLSVLEMVLPVVVLLAIGVFCRSSGLLSPDGVSGIKTLVTNIALPVVLFNSLATAHYSWNTVLMFVVIVGVNALALALGYLTRKAMGKNGKFSAFLMACGEVGMLGYALFELLVGSENLHYLASIDLGNILFAFSIYLALLLAEAGERPSVGQMVRNMFRQPCFMGGLLGAIAGATGLAGLVLSTPVGATIEAVISLITSPTSALILVAVGYGFQPALKGLSAVLRSILLRVVIMGAMFLLSSTILFQFIPRTQNQLLALLLYFFLPAPLFIPIYANDPEQEGFLSTSLSLSMVITVTVFIGMAVFVAV